MIYAELCPKCGGDGYRLGGECRFCSGLGTVLTADPDPKDDDTAGAA